MSDLPKIIQLVRMVKMKSGLKTSVLLHQKRKTRDSETTSPITGQIFSSVSSMACKMILGTSFVCPTNSTHSCPLQHNWEVSKHGNGIRKGSWVDLIQPSMVCVFVCVCACGGDTERLTSEANSLTKKVQFIATRTRVLGTVKEPWPKGQSWNKEVIVAVANLEALDPYWRWRQGYSAELSPVRTQYALNDLRGCQEFGLHKDVAPVWLYWSGLWGSNDMAQ